MADVDRVVIEAERDGDVERTGEPHLAIRTRAPERDGVVRGLGVPDESAEAERPAVQLVVALVGVEGVGDVVDREHRAAESVRESSDGDAQVRVADRILVRRNGVMTERQRDRPVRAGDLDARERGAQVEELDREAAGPFEAMAVHRRRRLQTMAGGHSIRRGHGNYRTASSTEGVLG